MRFTPTDQECADARLPRMPREQLVPKASGVRGQEGEGIAQPREGERYLRRGYSRFARSRALNKLFQSAIVTPCRIQPRNRQQQRYGGEWRYGIKGQVKLRFEA